MIRNAIRPVLVILAASFFIAPAAFAVNYFADGAGGAWTTNTTWHIGSTTGPNPVAGVYPGSATGDTVDLTSLGAYTITVSTLVPSSVLLTQSCTSCTLTIVSSGLLTLNGASSVAAVGVLSVSGGTLANSGTLTLSPGAELRMTGGTINGGGTINVNRAGVTNAKLQILSGTNSISNQIVSVDGRFEDTGGSLSIDDGTQIGVLAGGTFDIGDLAVNSNLISSPRIDNAGAVAKSTGAGTAAFNLTVNNSGTISVASGSLNLNGGGTQSGTFDATAAGTKIAFTGGTHTFSAGTFSGAGGFKLSGGTMDVDAPVTITPSFVQAGGVLTGNANVTFAAFTWEGGTMNASGGAGGTVLSGAALFDGLFGTMSLSGRPLTINAAVTVNYTPAGTNYLAIDSGANLSNFGTFNINGDVPINSNQLGGAVFNNNSAANLTKNGGSGFSRIFAAVNNNGFANVNNGQLAWNGGGTNGGTINLPAPANVLAIEDKNYSFSIGSLTGVGSLGLIRVDGASAVLTISTPFTTDNVEMKLGKIVATSFTIGKKLVWSGGILQGPGTFTLSAGTIIDHLAPTQGTTLDNATFLNNGTFNYDPTSFALTLTNGATFNNAAPGTFDIVGNSAILNGSGSNVFQDAGLLKKTAGTSGTRFDMPLDNLGGTISSQIAGGTIIVNNGGSMTGGTITTTTAGALVHFFNGTFTVTGGGFSGAGTIGVVGGTLQVNASVNATTTLQVDSGIVDVGSSTTFQITTLLWKGGTLQGAGTKRVFGGSISATAPTTLNGSGTLTIPAASFSYDADNVNYLTINNTAKLNVESGGTLTITANGLIAGAATARVASTGGALTKSGASTARIDVPLDFASSGSLNVTGGILEIGGGGTFGGTAILQITSPAVFTAVGGTLDLNASASVSGTGSFRINGGTVNVNTALTFADLLLDAGLLAGTANVGLDGGKWTGGNMDGTGITKVNTGKTFEIATGVSKKLRRNFTNDGTVVTQNLTVAITFENAALFTNNSLVQFQTNTNVFCSCTPTPSRFLNAVNGTLTQFNAAGTSNFLTPFDNDGSVDTQTGILNFLNGGTHTGAFTAGANTFLSFGGASDSFSAASTIGGTGAVGFGATTSSFAGTHTLTGDGLTIVQGGVTFTSASTIGTPALEIRSGSINGTSNINIAGGGVINSSWQGGTILGSGTLTLGAGAIMDFNASTAPITLDGRTFTNNGTVNYTATANSLTLTNNASIASSGVFDIQSDTAINSGPGSNSLDNSGTFQKTAGAATMTFAPAFKNSNTATFSSGTLAFAGGFLQTSGSTTLSGGNISCPFTIDVSGGTLAGNGTITGNVSNAGSVAPGLSPGSLTITGNYTQTASGILNIQLAGTTPVTLYDQLNVTGTASLNGTLDVTLIGGFTPANNNTFDVLTYASSSGAFATQNLPTFPSGGSLTSSQQPTQFRLTALVTQADVTAAQTNTGPALHGQDQTFSINVTNNGPNATGGVTLTDTMSGGALVSATSTIGSCTLTSPIVCTIGTLANGQSALVTITVNANTVGTITNSATVSATEFDPSTGNNTTSTLFVAIAPAADCSVSVVDAADPVSGSASTSYTVTVANAGPDSAASASVALALTNGTIVSTSSAAFTCSGSSTNRTCNAISALGIGGSTITVNVQAPSASGVMSLQATVSATTADPATGNNTQTQNTAVSGSADLVITKTGPAGVAPGGTLTFTIAVKNNGPGDATNVVVNDPTPPRASFNGTSGACTTSFPCNLGTIVAGQTKTINATYTASSSRSSEGRTINNVASVSTTAFDANPANDQDNAQTTIACQNEAPDRLLPAANQTVPASGTLSWRGNGASYTVYLGPAGSGCSMSFATSATESLPYSGLTPGGAYEWRVVSDRGQCPLESSACLTFKVENNCTRPEAPVARVVGQQTSSKTYAVEWDAVPGAVRYEVDEATNAQFTGATTTVVQGLSHDFKHDVAAAAAFFYRVRAFNDCFAEAGPYSIAVRVVIVPITPDDHPGRNVNIPAGSQELVVQKVFIPGEPNQSLFYNATTDRPWLTVSPASGPLPPQGVTVDVTADPRTLPNGTFTASLIVTVTGTSSVATNGTTSVTVPISINLVTPVSPVASKEAASQNAMIIPSIGHLDGINSFWQSDVRITNAGFRAYRYKLTFTPTGGTASGVKQTTITVDAGATTALDDIVRNWYGFGALGDNASGMLEILPIDDAAVASAATVASSRTYNVTGNGTLGQFIPAVRFPSFIGQATGGGLAPILSLQQVSEYTAYRTNLGIAEAGGSPASVLLTMFSGLGEKLGVLPLQLAAGEQWQLNSFFAQNGLSVIDGRVEVQVAGGGGKVTAYASVIDNNTRDPLLVNGALLQQNGATKWVLPGVANIDNPVAHWRTDMRVFNYGTSVQPATLTFYPSGNGTPKSANLTLDPGAVLTLDDVVSSRFGLVNAGGVVHLTTGNASTLVVTGRTYNQTSVGTFGQFIPAVTTEEAAGAGGPTLHILQVEDSTRYRTNIGLAEVTGAPALVELQVVLPDSKFTPTVQVPLAANEFRQFSLLRDLALGNVYNARVTMRVLSGAGRATAYGSVIDEQTQDPTYVPAQK